MLIKSLPKKICTTVNEKWTNTHEIHQQLLPQIFFSIYVLPFANMYLEIVLNAIDCIVL